MDEGKEPGRVLPRLRGANIKMFLLEIPSGGAFPSRRALEGASLCPPRCP